MIVYSATKAEFRTHVLGNRIDSLVLEHFTRSTGRSTGQSEIKSWRQSLIYMNNALDDPEIPADAGVAIEYHIPQSSKRVDFLVTGHDDKGRGSVVIIELKQWDKAMATKKDAIVRTPLGGSQPEVSHPSYQAWTYAELLRDFNEAVQQDNISLSACAYLHNMTEGSELRSIFYAEHLERAPLFLRSDADKLTAFIKKFVRRGDRKQVLFQIENSRIRPSKNLADKLTAMLTGNQEFIMIDDQKLVFETGLDLARTTSATKKNVFIVEGGPGTGKSVVAINLLVRMTEERLNARYVTRNAAPRAVYENVLTGTFRKTHITNLFSGSGAFTHCEHDTFDVLIVDEAHRLNEKSGIFKNFGENQVKEIIRAAKCSIFFLDEDQRVTWNDVGSVAEIQRWAESCNANVERMELSSQFRCNGSDGYLSWLDHTLQIRVTANRTLEGIDYDFRVLRDPNELAGIIEERNRERNKARMVAGYCWDWITKKTAQGAEHDIVFEEFDFRRKWNLDQDGMLWIRKPDSVNEVGCIHTCQGLEVDYIGVIIGPDLVVRDGEVLTRPEARSRMDSSIKGYKKALRQNPTRARKKADQIIKNTYRTLMSRGQKGCYVYCTDEETAGHFESLTKTMRHPAAGNRGEVARSQQQPGRRYPGLAFPVLPKSGSIQYEAGVPLLDLLAADGNLMNLDLSECDWVELPASFQPLTGRFVAQMTGDAMNRKIPRGAWCVFEHERGESIENRIVIAEHDEIRDPDTGGNHTVRRYRREGVRLPGGRVEQRIILASESTHPNQTEFVIAGPAIVRLRIVGVLVGVIE